MLEGKVSQALKLVDAGSEVSGVHQLTDQIREKLREKLKEICWPEENIRFTL